MITIAVFASATATVGKIKDGDTGATGPKGARGAKGADGSSLYMWVKYADTPTTGMSDNPDGKTYMGIAYNKPSANASTTYSDYTWIKVVS